jgi:hypothetical protein
MVLDLPESIGSVGVGGGQVGKLEYGLEMRMTLEMTVTGVSLS